MIKKRSRPQPRVREPSPEDPIEEGSPDSDEPNVPVADLLELRKLKKSRQGINVDKLSKGDAKKRKRKHEEEEDTGGLKPGAKANEEEDDALRDARRKVIRSNNFTQQTNALDVDKHMMEYIESNLTVRGKPQEQLEPAPSNPYDPMAHIAEKLKQQKQSSHQAASSTATSQNKEDGSVTNSMTMLTAIPEVDLGIDSRLKNIEDTEKAKRLAAEVDKASKHGPPDDEAHLVANRFYQPKVKGKTDEEILRDAKLEAMGVAVPQKQARSDHDRPQSATDDLVMENFKKRMRR